MNTLLVGFDSAWTATNSGAIVGVLANSNGTRRELGPPETVNFSEAERVLVAWEAEHEVATTVVLVDQPIIVKNATGQRPVEHIVSSVVCRRYGAMQPANTSKQEMFGAGAPVWSFLRRFGGAANPLALSAGPKVFETYPVLTIIALGWSLPDDRACGRLPKYNPDRRDTFSIADWRHVCIRAANSLGDLGLRELSDWAYRAAQLDSPRKRDQDRLDACLCLLAALSFADGKDCLMVGDYASGYIVVPDHSLLRYELEDRCKKTRRRPSEWVCSFRAQRAESVIEP